MIDVHPVPMPDTEHSIETRTKAVIRAEAARYAEEERDLLARVIAAERTASETPAVLDRDQKVQERARAKLNGQGARLLPRMASGAGGLEDLRIELESVRLIRTVLSKEAVEAEAIEAQETALKLEPAFGALIGEWLAAGRKFAQADARAQAYLDKAGDSARLIPMSGWIGAGANIRSPWGHDLDEMIAAAKAEGIRV